MKARLLLYMGMTAALFARTAGAGPWSIEPRLGVSADFSTNPVLREFDSKAEAHIAGLMDLPVRYDVDSLDVLLRPSARISDSRGYSSLASDYEHLDANAQINNELGATTVQAGLARDSSLYYAGSLANGIGVRRDSAATGVSWSRSVAERAQTQVDASWSRVRYDEPASFNYLVNYRYLSAGPSFSYAATERDTIKILANAGQYQSLDGITESRSGNVQLGVSRQLSEIWTLSASAGHSRSKNSEKIYVGPFLLGALTSTQDGTVYSATVTRQGERFSLIGGASRTLQPTGFAYLSRQDSFNLNATYARSERWDFAVTAAWAKAVNPDVGGRGAVLRGRESTVRYLNSQLTANWHWTPQWIVSFHATRITDKYGPPAASGASTGFGLDLSRQFLRTEF
ncbi:MAG TPA: hypothetical protein VKP66_00670 [Steroidobacteraceae bacterium]|nr:hypothetical protein [Steroidobacteraceae bacterium]